MKRFDKHIDLTLEVVRRFWKKNPDLRLCQLIVNANGGEDPYNVEDGVLMERLGIGMVGKLEKIRIPVDLNDCFIKLNKMLSQDQIKKIKRITEVSMNHYHHGFGTSLRNSWGLWGDSVLAKWFNERGIHHADDMSCIILTSFWRYMNGKRIEFDEQVKHFKKYWEEKEE